MRTWFERVRRMTVTDHATAVEVLVLALWIEMAIRTMPFSRLLDRVNRHTSAKRASVGPVLSDRPAAAYQRLVRFVAVAYDLLPLPPTCLRQSLVLQALLARRGVPSRCCVGVAKHGPALAAHAWVECDGVALDATALQFGELQTHRT
jgi:hypothetical protein